VVGKRGAIMGPSAVLRVPLWDSSCWGDFASQHIVPHARHLAVECMRCLGRTARPLLAKVLLDRQAGTVGSRDLRGLQPLELVLESRKGWLRERAVRQHSRQTVEGKAWSRVVEQVADVVVKINRRPATLAASRSGYRHRAVETDRCSISIVNVVAFILRRGGGLARGILRLLLALRQSGVRQSRATASRQSGQLGLTLVWRQADR
jgi:hypothetical protein